MGDTILPDTSFNWSGLFQKASPYFILALAMMIVIIGVFYWAVAIRRRKSPRSGFHRRRSRHHQDKEQQEESAPDHHKKHRHRRRRSKHPKYPANPTLAETGGLPPVRKDEHPGSSGWPKD